MKQLLLATLVCASSLRAEISYNKLYAQTAAIAAVGIGTGFAVSEDPCVRSAFAAIGILGAASYYKAWRPENRMRCNTKNFNTMYSSELLAVVFSAHKDNNFSLSAFITYLSEYYVESRNPLYRAGKDLLSLKKQCDAIVEESKTLLSFYSSCLYANSDYQETLNNHITVTILIRDAVVMALAQLKNSQEYKDALSLQIQIDQQEAMARIAAAQQTQAINSYANYWRPSTIIIQ